MADGFLGRWSQRKQALREGKVPDEPSAPTSPALANPAAAAAPEASAQQPEVKPQAPLAAKPAPATPPTLAPTLEDVQALHADSNFAPFVARDVAPEVRNAAMKKLFADPRYNVMDGLDIYIDDYSMPSPMPASMLRQMASAKFLNLFDEEEEQAHKAPTDQPARPDSLATAVPSTAATQNTDPQQDPALNPTQDPHHDHTDLRLQPDHAARPEGPEREPERAVDAALGPVPPPSR